MIKINQPESRDLKPLHQSSPFSPALPSPLNCLYNMKLLWTLFFSITTLNFLFFLMKLHFAITTMNCLYEMKLYYELSFFMKLHFAITTLWTVFIIWNCSELSFLWNIFFHQHSELSFFLMKLHFAITTMNCLYYEITLNFIFSCPEQLNRWPCH